MVIVKRVIKIPPEIETLIASMDDILPYINSIYMVCSHKSYVMIIN